MVDTFHSAKELQKAKKFFGNLIKIGPKRASTSNFVKWATPKQKVDDAVHPMAA